MKLHHSHNPLPITQSSIVFRDLEPGRNRILRILIAVTALPTGADIPVHCGCGTIHGELDPRPSARYSDGARNPDDGTHEKVAGCIAAGLDGWMDMITPTANAPPL